MLNDMDLGTVLTVAEFDQLAEESRLVEDLLDRDDLAPGEFTSRAMERANASLHPGGHMWIRYGQRVTLIRGDFRQPLESLIGLINRHQRTAQDLEKTVLKLIQEASK